MNSNERVYRVCLVTGSTSLGGAEKSLIDLADQLSKKRGPFKFSTWMLVPKTSGPLIDQLCSRGIHYRVLPTPSLVLMMSRSTPIKSLTLGFLGLPQLLVYLIRLIKVIRSEGAYIVHSNGIKSHIFCGITKPALRCQSIFWHLRDIVPPGPTLSGLQTIARVCRPHLIANSKASLNAFLLGKLTTLKKKLGRTVAYNGLDPNEYFPAPNDRYRNIFNASADTVIIGIVGTLARWKGQELFIDMAYELYKVGIKARFVIIGSQIYDTIGDSNFEAELKQKVLKLGLSSIIEFIGQENNAPIAINGLDLLVHASTQPEPFGRVIIEAMACSIPVVATAAGGVLEIIEDKKNGLLYSPGDLSQLVNRVIQIIENSDLRAQLVKNGYATFLKKFTLKSHVERVKAAYAQEIDANLQTQPRL